jgi:hypothetical protein
MRVGKGKKTALLQTLVVLGLVRFANVLFCAWAVECPIPNAPKRRNARGGKKLKPLVQRFPKALTRFVILFAVIVKSAKMCHKAFGLHLT